MVLQLLQTEPDQLTKIGAIVWGMTGAAIGLFFIFTAIVGAVLNLVPGLPHLSWNSYIYLTFMGIVITFVLTVFYTMCGAALGSLMENSVNWVLSKMGGIKIRVRKL
jgi:hypothetical protein